MTCNPGGTGVECTECEENDAELENGLSSEARNEWVGKAVMRLEKPPHNPEWVHDEWSPYSTEWWAAGEVVEKMNAPFTLAWFPDATEEPRWKAGFYFVRALADTAPAAICVAALICAERIGGNLA